MDVGGRFIFLFFIIFFHLFFCLDASGDVQIY